MEGAVLRQTGWGDRIGCGGAASDIPEESGKGPLRRWLEPRRREPEDKPVRWCDLHVPRGRDELVVFEESWGGQAGDGWWQVIESETEGQEGPLDPVRSQ